MLKVWKLSFWGKCDLQNMERGKSEERPVLFHSYLSIFLYGHIKEKPWETRLGQQLALLHSKF